MSTPNESDELSESAVAFEAGVADYFKNFSHRLARELVHQVWLLMSVSKYISPQLLVGELQVANQDLQCFGNLHDKESAVNFDFAITRSEIDLRTWKTQAKGTQDKTTWQNTLHTLEQTDVLAEFKVASSTSTTRKTLIHDITKMACAMQFLKSQGCQRYPACYYIVLDPDRKLHVSEIMKMAEAEWPEFVPFPKILIGTDTE